MPNSLAVTCSRDIERAVRIPVGRLDLDRAFYAPSQKLNATATTRAPDASLKDETVYFLLRQGKRPLLCRLPRSHPRWRAPQLAQTRLPTKHHSYLLIRSLKSCQRRLQGQIPKVIRLWPSFTAICLPFTKTMFFNHFSAMSSSLLEVRRRWMIFPYHSLPWRKYRYILA